MASTIPSALDTLGSKQLSAHRLGTSPVNGRYVPVQAAGGGCAAQAAVKAGRPCAVPAHLPLPPAPAWAPPAALPLPAVCHMPLLKGSGGVPHHIVPLVISWLHAPYQSCDTSLGGRQPTFPSAHPLLPPTDAAAPLAAISSAAPLVPTAVRALWALLVPRLSRGAKGEVGGARPVASPPFLSPLSSGVGASHSPSRLSVHVWALLEARAGAAAE